MDFVLKLRRTKKGSDSIFFIEDRFSKMTHFITCHKINDATNIVNLFFKNVVRLDGIPKMIVSDRDVKFLSHFWQVMWGKLGSKLLFSIVCHPQTDGHTEGVYRMLGSLLQIIISHSFKSWEDCFPMVKLVHNYRDVILKGKRNTTLMGFYVLAGRLVRKLRIHR